MNPKVYYATFVTLVFSLTANILLYLSSSHYQDQVKELSPRTIFLRNQCVGIYKTANELGLISHSFEGNVCYWSFRLPDGEDKIKFVRNVDDNCSATREYELRYIK
jgi:hypothetical protein